VFPGFFRLDGIMIVKGASPAAMTSVLIMPLSDGFLALVLINALTGKVGTRIKMSGKATQYKRAPFVE
jgi:uncharacterized membrane protein